jgi:hypothetical protein
MDKSILEEIINDWDPVNLFPYSPCDEYKDEISKIISLLKQTTDVNQVAKGIQQIFINEFGEDVFKKSENECKIIARKIINSVG